MARVTVEDCLKQVDNRFALVHLAAKRVRQLRRGATPRVVPKNKEVVVALRELAAAEIEPTSFASLEAFDAAAAEENGE